MSEPDKQGRTTINQADQRGHAAVAPSSSRKQQKPHRSSSMGVAVFVLITAVAVAAVGAHHKQLINLRNVQQLIMHPIQEHIAPVLAKLSLRWQPGSTRSSGSISTDHLFTREELELYTGEHALHKGQIYIAILGQVFDVSKAPQFYGRSEGYGHFAGTDASKSFITGDFENDITDDVTSLDAEACLGLMGWLDFYHKTYTYKGKLVGRFYDSHGQATPELDSVHQRAEEGKMKKAAREAEEANWPSCNTKWTQTEGGSVWCDEGMYPRKLFVEMKNGKAIWRCACFKELGWSDVRKVYVDCDPDAHYCKTNAEAEAADENRDMDAELKALFT